VYRWPCSLLIDPPSDLASAAAPTTGSPRSGSTAGPPGGPAGATLVTVATARSVASDVRARAARRRSRADRRLARRDRDLRRTGRAWGPLPRTPVPV